ncbi:UNVERIFIED_ORG: hypothetical protein C7429_102139 [Pantoea allii]
MNRFFTHVCPMPNGFVVLNVSSGMFGNSDPSSRG